MHRREKKERGPVILSKAEESSDFKSETSRTMLALTHKKALCVKRSFPGTWFTRFPIRRIVTVGTAFGLLK